VSEYDSLVEGYDSSLPTEDKGPLSDEEHQALEEGVGFVETTFPAMTTPLPQMELEGLPELRILRGDQEPAVGSNYVIWDGLPRAITRSLALTEDEFVRNHMDVSGLKDTDGNRAERAERTLRMRYRGYLCGQLNSL
jgi:hypothetical protein